MNDDDRALRLLQGLRAVGWNATSGVENLHLEAAGAPGFRVARAYSPRGTYDSVIVPRGLLVMLVLEGSGAVTHDGVTAPYEQDRIVVLDAGAPSTVEVHRPTARLLWRFDRSVVLRESARGLVGEPVPVAPAVWSPVRALANGLIDGDPAISRSIHAARASELLLASVLECVSDAARQRRRRSGGASGEAIGARAPATGWAVRRASGTASRARPR